MSDAWFIKDLHSQIRKNRASILNKHKELQALYANYDRLQTFMNTAIKNEKRKILNGENLNN